jgi:tRNA pseudouridine38-40 synthase
VRYAARLAYHGAAYQGFQRLGAGRPTIQGTVEDALSVISSAEIRVIGAGRTDTGVHASGQVIAFDLEWHHPTQALLQAMNGHLPSNIAVVGLMVAADNFHPRYDAHSREYLYRIHYAPTRDPLRLDQVWHRWSALDLTAMQACLTLLVGEHDFATFGQPTVGESTIRQLQRAEIACVGDEIHITLVANAFLRRMVRSIVGTLVEVGQQRMSVAQFAEAFAAKERSMSGQAAPPHGLVFSRVVYDNEIDQLFAET